MSTTDKSLIKNVLKELLTGLETHDDLVEIRRKVMLASIGLGDSAIKTIQSNYHHEFIKAVKKFETDVEEAFNLK
jgi:hypothetical protein